VLWEALQKDGGAVSFSQSDGLELAEHLQCIIVVRVYIVVPNSHIHDNNYMLHSEWETQVVVRKSGNKSSLVYVTCAYLVIGKNSVDEARYVDYGVHDFDFDTGELCRE
jgi:hypothetical protein